MDARKEFKQLLDKYGHYVLIARQNKRIRCTCWNDTTRSANSQCTQCLGTGYLYVLEKALCRSKISNLPETLGRSLSNTEAGIIASISKIFYVQHTVFVSKKDLIYECDWEGNKPVQGFYSDLFEVNFPEAQRDINGRVNHVEVHCAREPINAEIRLNVMANQYTAGIIIT